MLDCSSAQEPCQSSSSNGGGGGGTLFYVRMYGPAVTSGLVQDYHNGTYECTFAVMDAGVYTIEVVVTYSQPPPVEDFPLPSKKFPTTQEPPYEGHLVAGFPIVVYIPTVTNTDSPTSRRTNMYHPKERGNRRTMKAVYSSYTQPPVDHSQQQQRRHCTTVDLTETSSTSAYYKARWVVTDRVNQAHHQIKTAPQSVNLEQYQWSLNGLGIQMQYQYQDCDIPVDDPITNRFTTAKQRSEPNVQQDVNHNNVASLISTCLAPTNKDNSNSNNKLQFLLIGDSTMRLQKDYLESYLSQLFPNGYGHMIQITFIELFGGMLKCQYEGRPNVTQLLEKQRRRQQKGGRRQQVIMFNSGLHDIHRLCGQQWKEDRATYLNHIPDLDLSCPQLYREALTELVQKVAQTPAVLRIFQTTTAGT
jgi:hypothetical protein